MGGKQHPSKTNNEDSGLEMQRLFERNYLNGVMRFFPFFKETWSHARVRAFFIYIVYKFLLALL